MLNAGVILKLFPQTIDKIYIVEEKSTLQNDLQRMHVSCKKVGKISTPT